MPVTVGECRAQLAARLVEEAPTLEDFRTRWIGCAQNARHARRNSARDESEDVCRVTIRIAAFTLAP
jgi:hypothetical protein